MGSAPPHPNQPTNQPSDAPPPSPPPVSLSLLPTNRPTTHPTPPSQAFLAPEAMRGRNEVSCEQCRAHPAAAAAAAPVTVTLQIQLLQAPRYLRLHLIRHGKEDVKIQDPVEVDEELDLGAITGGGAGGCGLGGRYRLSGIIYHLGISMQSGHYKAEFRDGRGKWWKADDTAVRAAGGPSTGVGQGGRQEQQRAKKDAYYLIYERVEEEGEAEALRVPTEEEVKALIPAALQASCLSFGGLGGKRCHHAGTFPFCGRTHCCVYANKQLCCCVCACAYERVQTTTTTTTTNANDTQEEVAQADRELLRRICAFTKSHARIKRETAERKEAIPEAFSDAHWEEVARDGGDGRLHLLPAPFLYSWCSGVKDAELLEDEEAAATAAVGGGSGAAVAKGKGGGGGNGGATGEQQPPAAAAAAAAAAMDVVVPSSSSAAAAAAANGGGEGATAGLGEDVEEPPEYAGIGIFAEAPRLTPYACPHSRHRGGQGAFLLDPAKAHKLKAVPFATYHRILATVKGGALPDVGLSVPVVESRGQQQAAAGMGRGGTRGGQQGQAALPFACGECVDAYKQRLQALAPDAGRLGELFAALEGGVGSGGGGSKGRGGGGGGGGKGKKGGGGGGAQQQQEGVGQEGAVEYLIPSKWCVCFISIRTLRFGMDGVLTPSQHTQNTQQPPPPPTG